MPEPLKHEPAEHRNPHAQSRNLDAAANVPEMNKREEHDEASTYPLIGPFSLHSIQSGALRQNNKPTYPSPNHSAPPKCEPASISVGNLATSSPNPLSASSPALIRSSDSSRYSAPPPWRDERSLGPVYIKCGSANPIPDVNPRSPARSPLPPRLPAPPSKPMSWELLQRFFDSDVFNSNPFLPVSYLSRYADHVGIHYVLCNKLRQFPYEDIEFFLPQLCHLIISVDNESMALEEFLLDLCEESVTAALLTFWLFQTYLHDLSSNPQSTAFQTCRRVYNKVQHIVFGLNDVGRHEKIKENILPVTVLSSFVLASVALPMIPRWAGPLAVAQARKPQPINNTAATETTDDAKPSKSQAAVALNAKPKRSKESRGASIPSANLPSPSRAVAAKAIGQATTASPRSKLQKELKRPPALDIAKTEAMSSSASLPLPSPPQTTRPETPPLTAGLAPRNHSGSILRRHSHHTKNAKNISDLSSIQKTRLLRQHYFRSQTQFLQALEDISNRLVIVPKQARMSALRAELALIARDLPAEIDVPVICPPTLVDGAPGKSRHHRIVRLNPTEATVLNSAEKVPYLLMVEVLREDFSFDPETPDNQRLLPELFGVRGNSKRLFDLSSELPKSAQATPPPEPAVDSVFEPTSGDLSSSNLIKSLDEEGHSRPAPKQLQSNSTQRLSSGATTSSTTLDAATPRTSGASRSRSSSPGSRRKMTLQMNRNASSDQPDFSALATHMRTAAQMLAQLDATSGKRPKHEVAAIRAKIIASMQTLEERSFDADDQGPTFDTIIAKASTAAAATAAASASTSNPDLDEDAPVDTNLNASAGRERMENDFKTGGVQRRGDRDDPSAAVFGEAWEAKKERIRKSSPYGWMKNWDLVSVIVKTGADLRQEAFACQLINVCHKIWVDAGVDVWVKLMRILVTGESSGLIETITNGVSLHSLKRSLTMASIESGKNPRHRIATLKDHFLKAFGERDSEPHRAGIEAFKRSLAAYSVISYILQLKDRHNGNVLIDSEGHIVHIDFGFMLSNSPGSVGFEAAPFKLTHEYVDVLGGLGSPDYEDYKKLCKQAFQALRRSADYIIDLVAMMGRESKMPCFSVGVATATSSLRQRFQLHLSADEAEQFVETDLIAKSFGSYYTRLYDTFQYRTQGIY